jgi:predicted sugar kinase
VPCQVGVEQMFLPQVSTIILMRIIAALVNADLERDASTIYKNKLNNFYDDKFHFSKDSRKSLMFE